VLVVGEPSTKNDAVAGALGLLTQCCVKGEIVMQIALTLLALLGLTALSLAEESSSATPDLVLRGLRDFYQKTARGDGSFQNGVDPDYLGMSDSAYSDFAAVTYAVTIHKTFGWKLPHEAQTIAWLLGRQQASGEFVNIAGTADPKSPQGRVYNTTQALVALHALGVKPKYDPLPVFEEIMKQDYKTLPAYSTSFFPLAYLCAGRPIPEQADRAIRALMIPDEDGYLNNHVAATFHSSHYYALVGEPTPKGRQMVERVLKEQSTDGSWLLNSFSRDRHATFDALFVLKHEGQSQHRDKIAQALGAATKWILACRNADGGFGHFPGSTSDADANYFQAGGLVMTGFLKPSNPIADDPHLLSWGHLLPERRSQSAQLTRKDLSGWVGQVAFSGDGRWLAACTSIGRFEAWHDEDKFGWAKRIPGACLSSVALSPDGKAAIVGSFDGSVHMLDSGSGERRLGTHRGPVSSVAYSPDGSLIASGGLDRTIRVWDGTTGEPRRTLSGHKSWVNALVFLKDGTLVSGSSDGTVRLWDVATGENAKTIQATKGEVRSIAVSFNGERIAAGLRYGATKVWDTSDWKETVIEQKADEVWSVVFSADGEQIITAAGEWNRPTDIVFWDIASKKPAKTLRHTGEVLSLALSPDGKQLAAGGADKAVSIWQLER
jgi:hypothetical protein